MTEIDKLHIGQYRNEIFICSRCNYCREMVRTKDHTYSICPIRENTSGFESFIARGKLLLLQGILDGDLEITQKMAEIFFTCTTCGNCKVHCPAGIDTVKLFEAFRADLQALELGYSTHIALQNYTKKEGNPYNEVMEKRLLWIPNYEKKHIDKPSRLGYFVGCTSSYRSPEIATAFYHILEKSGVDFTILSNEVCCESPLLRTGLSESASDNLKLCIEKFKELGVEEIVFTCAGCLKAFDKDHRKLLGKIKPISYLKVLDRLISESKLIFQKNTPVKVTYHDPCHSTKGLSTPDYKTARVLLGKIPGIELVEMKSHAEGSMCCGAGGGVKSAFPELALKIAEKRLKEALETHAEYLISSCPFCKRNLKDAATKNNWNIKVIDIAELILNRL